MGKGEACGSRGGAAARLAKVGRLAEGLATLQRRDGALSFDRTMKPRRFQVTRRPRLAEMVEQPKMEFADYERRLTSLQGVLQLIQQAYLGSSERAIIVLEGWDTAGKGGIVRRLGWALDPRSFKVNPISSPDEHERAQHYLQRFWRRLPEKGQIVAFDRSWYGRVLVERVEAFASEKEWRRAYREINEFERVLIDSGVRLVKLFLHITPDEQMLRFRSRLIDPVKRWKLSYEDFRNRSHWAEYETAIEDMMAETSTKYAPWHLIPANNKPYGRIAAFRVIKERLGKDVSLEPRPIDPGLMREAKQVLGLSPSDIQQAAEPAERKEGAKRSRSTS
jgi:polyphosphate kinase 2 (PPK2 family)